MKLETQRLILRDWQESDVDSYMILATDVGYNCFSIPGRFLVNTPDEAKERIQKSIDLFAERKLGKFPIFLKDTGEFIGTCGMEPYELDGPQVELSYRLCLKYWGHGFATEAAAAVLKYGFDDLDMKRIIAMVIPQNRSSVRILEQLGFCYVRDFIHAGQPRRLYELSAGAFQNSRL